MSEDVPMTLYLALLAVASDRVRVALAGLNPVAVQRAELDYAAVALHACDRAVELGVPEPAGLRTEVATILERYERGA